MLRIYLGDGTCSPRKEAKRITSLLFPDTELGLIACMVSVTRRRKTPVLLGFMETASFTDGVSTGKDSAFLKAETG